MKKAIILWIGLGVVACNTTPKETPVSQEKEDKEEKHGHGHGHKKEGHTHGSANEYMHQSSVEDLIKRFESPERDAYQQPEKVMDYLGDIQGMTIMDIGSGSGYFSVKLAEQGAQVIAADVDDDFQQFIKDRIAENNLKNIETRKIPFDAPGLMEEEVDKAFMVNTYHHIENRVAYFEKVKNGTKPDGELVLIDFFKSESPVGPPVEHKLAIDQVVDELKKAGYATFEVKVDLLPYQYIIRAK